MICAVDGNNLSDQSWSLDWDNHWSFQMEVGSKPSVHQDLHCPPARWTCHAGDNRGRKHPPLSVGV